MRELLLSSGMAEKDIDERVFHHLLRRYGSTLHVALLDNEPAVAKDLYDTCLLLPQTSTDQQLSSELGLKVNGPLYPGSTLTIVYKDEDMMLLKGLDADELRRAEALQAMLSGKTWPEHITTFDLVKVREKVFMVMPMYSGTLEPIPYLSLTGTERAATQLIAALSSLHDLGVAHCDVKPANICLTGKGLQFVLIDLGSVAKFGERTKSTPAYIPLGMDKQPMRASAALDWWMLAVTLAEKGCGQAHALEVGGFTPSPEQLRTRLAAHLPPAVWELLKLKLE